MLFPSSFRLHLDITSRSGLIAALMASALASLPSQILPLTVGAMTDDLGLDPIRTSWLASADLVGIALAASTGFFWVPRLDLYRVVMVGLTAFILGNLMVLSLLESGSFWAMMGPRLLSGLGAGLVNTAAIATLARHPNPERAFGLNLLVVVLLASCSYTALPTWIQSGGLPTAFILMIGLGFLIWVQCLWSFPDAKIRAVTTTFDGKPPPLPWNKTGILVIATFLSSASMMAIWAYTERIGVTAGIDLVTVGSIMAFGFLLSSSTCFLASWQGNRYGRRFPLLISAFGMLIALSLMGAPAGPTFLLMFTFGVFTYSSMWNYSIPFKSAMVASLDPHGRTVALFVAVSAIATAAGPMIGGYIGADGDYQRVLLYSGIGFIGAILTFVIMDRRQLAELKTQVVERGVEKGVEKLNKETIIKSDCLTNKKGDEVIVPLSV